ncbi:DNA repair exonuclease [Filobacillus milosensis]|uniref:DNA repair exonuclease n=1 Tax=Filobacillus milosensis TaxID=94137 RepID=A0A4Y8ILI3_9BACI|nr:DNA repair exonuclease [Filobacillus milosensis]TFB22103.1 DNA repair exonuclease [Filobacillus milosensis]
MSKEVIRFLHSADLHLDSPYKGMKNLPNRIYQDIKDSTLKAFRRLIDVAIDQQVDFVLIVGDLFDQDSNSIKALVELKRGLEKLNSHDIQAYISFGNHDYMMLNKAELNFPSNTYVFPTGSISNVTFDQNEQPLVEISGFSYWEQSVSERMVEQYQKTTHAPFHIATLHGSLQNNLDHDTYAPFLLEDLKDVEADYWALGHIHKRDILMTQPYAVYPGNIQGRHMKEIGPKGCYIVEMTSNQTDLQFYPLQEVTFQSEEIVLEEMTEVEDIIKTIEKVKENYKQQKEKVFIRLKIYINESGFEITREQEEEILNLINEEEENDSSWVWVNECSIVTHPNYNRDELKQTNPFIGEVLQMVDEQEDIDAYIDELLNHRIFKKHINFDVNQIKDEIKTEAEKTILNELLRNR